MVVSGGRSCENSRGIGLVVLWKPKARECVADHMEEEKKCIYGLHGVITCEVEMKGRRTRSGFVFLMEGTSVFALLHELEVKIRALSVLVCRMLC